MLPQTSFNDFDPRERMTDDQQNVSAENLDDQSELSDAELDQDDVEEDLEEADDEE